MFKILTLALLLAASGTMGQDIGGIVKTDTVFQGTEQDMTISLCFLEDRDGIKWQMEPLDSVFQIYQLVLCKNCDIVMVHYQGITTYDNPMEKKSMDRYDLFHIGEIRKSFTVTRKVK